VREAITSLWMDTAEAGQQQTLTKDKKVDVCGNLPPGFPFGEIADKVFLIRASDLIRQCPSNPCVLRSSGID
jgi:hypothetical protein